MAKRELEHDLFGQVQLDLQGMHLGQPHHGLAHVHRLTQFDAAGGDASLKLGALASFVYLAIGIAIGKKVCKPIPTD